MVIAVSMVCLSHVPVLIRGISAVLIALLSGLAAPSCHAAKTPLPIMMINPGGSWIGIDRAMELAAKDINNRDDILDDYELQLIANYSNVSLFFF